MNLNEILKEEEIEQQETPQMSIGQQLDIMSKVKEIEYQNSLVMASLEKYNQKYEELKKEQTMLLEKFNQKINQIMKANEILNQNMKNQIESLSQRYEKEILSLNDKSISLIESTKNEIDELLESKFSVLSKKSTSYISQVEELKNEAQKRHELFYKRKKIIDYVVIISSILSPISIVFLIYWTIFR